jgi:flagellar assembly protein FliH
MSSKVFRDAQAPPCEPVVWAEVGERAGGRVMDTLPFGQRSRSAPPLALDGGEQTGLAEPGETEKKVAWQDGYRQGEAEGFKKARRQAEVLERRLAVTIEEVALLRPRLRRQAERQMVELALAVARRILHRQLNMDPEALLGIVKAALERVGAREVVEIRVAPAFKAKLESALAGLGRPSATRLVDDPGLEAGAVLIETDRGRLDASVATQLEEIERGFADLMGEENRR